jgi:starch-binding outer membrane protein, SusD/RagB family
MIMRKIYITTLTLVLFAVACNDDEFLQQEPHNLTDRAFYTSPGGALQGLNAAYDILQLGENVERITLQGTVCSGDAMAGGEPGGQDQPALQAMMRFTLFPDNLYVNRFWASMYTGIYRCNLLIGYMEDKDGLSPDFKEGMRQQIIGEATFLRGLFHFQLQIRYGGYPQIQDAFGGQLKGVPFIDHVLPPDEWKQSRPELSYTWDRIEEDFINAAALLPEKSQLASTDLGRATRGAALSMLAKTHLYQEEWQEAYNAAEQVINSGEYWLEGGDNHPGPYTVTRTTHAGPTPVQMTGYKWIWQPEANNCGEDVFSVQHYQEGTLRYPEGGEGNLLCRYYGPRAYHLAFEKEFPDRADGETSVRFNESTEYFWGFILPTTYFINTAYEDIGCEVDGEILDPRFELSVMKGDDLIPIPSAQDVSFEFEYQTTGGETVAWDTTISFVEGDSVPYDGWYNWPTPGNATWKYFTDPIYFNRTSTLADYPQNTKLIRFADVLLIGAEAAVHIGQNGSALNWINKVRTRARNAGNTDYPHDLTGTITAEQVWAERRVELAFEGHQFFDIVRTGRAAQVLKVDAYQNGWDVTTNPIDGSTAAQQFGDAFQVGKNEIWPIPETEMIASDGSIAQNPNY